MTAAEWKERLELQPHPEGGWFAEWYRSEDRLTRDGLPDRFPGERVASTAIAYLLEGRECSRYHRIRSDELWHHYDGDVLELFEVTVDGELNRHLLGGDGMPFLMIPAGSWFASRVMDGSGFVLAGCTVAPGFEFEDFEMAGDGVIQTLCPQAPEIE